MPSSEFLAALQSAGAILSSTTDSTTVESFGNAASELPAAQSSSVVCPLVNLIRIRATGKDRAKFLHSFCTNNVSALQVGQICEAFFTDVKAKVLAHGFVVATGDAHEIWMLPGDEQALLTHLNRYIITEDVVIQRVAEHSAFAVIGPQVAATLKSLGLTLNSIAGEGVITPDLAVVATTWADAPIAFVSVPSTATLTTWQVLINAGAVPAGEDVFQHIRILDGFPLIGVDLTSDNMAPEADRNETAISYTKGCYLGQEPIARLDAMGHVNRKLYKATAAITPDDVAIENAPVPTSVSQIAVESQVPVLIVLPVRSVVADEGFSGALSEGTSIRLTVSNAKPQSE